MPKKYSRKNDKTADLAAPLRDFLRSTLRKKIRTAKDKEKLAKFLGQAPVSVNNLLKGEGGLDTWTAALIYCYDFDIDTLIDFVRNYQAMLRKYRPQESDKIAAEIALPEKKRRAIFSALLTALAIEEDLEDDKK